MLGHESPEMRLVYASIFGETIKNEYEKTIGTVKQIAGGELADVIKVEEMKPDEVDWIKKIGFQIE